LIEFMTFKMRNNLQSIGRLDLMDQINSEVEKYNLSKASDAETFGGTESAKEIFRAAANLSNKGDSLKAKGKLAEAYDVYRQALELDKQAVALEPENLHFVHGLSVVSAKLGDCAEQLGDLFMADLYYKHCIATRRDLVDREPDNPRWSLELAKAYRAKAGLLFDQEKFDEAEDETRLAQRSLDKIETARSENPEYLHGRAATYSLLGDILARKEAFADSRQAYGQVMSIALRLCSMEPANVNWQHALSVAHANLARLARQERDYPLARKHFDEALNINAKLASADPLNENRRFSVFLSQEALGDLARGSGDKEQALGRYGQAMEVLDGLLATDAGASNYLWLVRSAQTAGNISELLRTQGSEDQAAKWSERAERDEAKAKKIWQANQKLSE
jgi:tetratricopeptide (TPR) repeat protein